MSGFLTDMAGLDVVIVALIGLAGVYVGWLLHRKDQAHQEEREDAYRWHQDQLNAYAHYLAAVSKNYFRWTGFTSVSNFEQHVETVRARGEEWMETKAVVDILSSPEVMEAADEMADALADVVDRVSTFQGKPRLRWRHSSEDPALEEFRQALSLPGRSISEQCDESWASLFLHLLQSIDLRSQRSSGVRCGSDKGSRESMEFSSVHWRGTGSIPTEGTWGSRSALAVGDAALELLEGALAFHVHVWEDPVEPVWEPPVGPVEHHHR
jgi:hypothetical protein